MLTIGRSNKNDIVWNHVDVSSEGQGYVQMDGDDFILHHKGRNDTKVNGRAIKKCLLVDDDDISVGNFKTKGSNLITELKHINNQSRTDFSNEFQKLLRIYGEFEAKKDKIQRPSKIPTIIRVVLSGGVLVVLFKYPELVPNEKLRYPMIFGAGLLATIFSGVGNNKVKRRKKLDDLELQYMDLLKCPKCKGNLAIKSKYYWERKNECLHKNCDAIYDLVQKSD